MSRTPQQAFKDAMESGALQAWLDGKEVEFRNYGDEGWSKTSTLYPFFASTAHEWRPSPPPLPPEAPVVKWINIKDQKPSRMEDHLVCGYFSSPYNWTVRTALWNAFNKAFVGFPEAQYWSPMPNPPKGD